MSPVGDLFEVHMRKARLLLILGASGMLSSCDLSQIPGLDKRLSIEDSKAVGAACRHSGRALEDCFALNPNTHPAGVFEGWRDMNDYMTANNIETVSPKVQASKFTPPSTGSYVPKASGSTNAPLPSAPGASVPERPRFDPNSLGQSSPDQTGQSSVEPAPAQAPSSEPAASSPPRPWERSSDGKNTT